jgi:hypothetical protein
MDPKDTLMHCSEGWMVHYALFFFMLWLFQAHVRSTLCSLLNTLHGTKIEKGGGSVVGDVLSFFCLWIKMAIGAILAGNTTLLLVLD